jgi:hypothetical protein
MWFFVAMMCGMYFFLGIGVAGLAWETGNWILIALAIDGWLLNLCILEYAKRKEW